MVFIITMISFFLENLFSYFFNYPPLYNLFVITTLVFIHPFFQNNNDKYLKYCLIVGILYDLILTNSLFFNTILFVGLGIIIIKINIYFVNNMYSTIFISLVIIFIYLLVTYLIYNITGKLEFNLLVFLKQFYDTLLLSVLYSGMFFIIVEKLSKKYKILKMN